MFNISVKEANGNPGQLTKEDVWGAYDLENRKRLSKGMIVARGLPEVDRYFTQAQKDSVLADGIPDICPIWLDILPYKSVTAVCDGALAQEVSYWLEYVQGGGCVSNIKDLPDGKIALRSDYKCW